MAVKEKEKSLFLFEVNFLVIFNQSCAVIHRYPLQIALLRINVDILKAAYCYHSYCFQSLIVVLIIKRYLNQVQQENVNVNIRFMGLKLCAVKVITV